MRALADSGIKAGTRTAPTDSPGVPKQERAIHTRRQLLNHLRPRRFRSSKTSGYRRIRGQDEGALYAHFQDKEDLFFALAARDLAQDNAVFQRKLRPNSARDEQISALVSLILREGCRWSSVHRKENPAGMTAMTTVTFIQFFVVVCILNLIGSIRVEPQD